jgi:hypothetical protein
LTFRLVWTVRSADSGPRIERVSAAIQSAKYRLPDVICVFGLTASTTLSTSAVSAVASVMNSFCTIVLSTRRARSRAASRLRVGAR